MPETYDFLQGNLSDRLGVLVDQNSATSGGLVSDAIGAITRHIRDHDLMPGDRLPSEATLSKELHVSRTVVREAFRSLAAMRIIELATGKRATISPIDHGAMSLIMEHGLLTQQINIQQIYDVRRTIETRIVTLAAIRRSDAEADQLTATAADMRTAAGAGDLTRLMELDLRFHEILGQGSRNPVFALIMGAFQGITRQTWPIGWRSRTTAPAREKMIATHEDIASAIAKGDPVTAAAAMTVHFDESVRALVAAGLS